MSNPTRAESIGRSFRQRAAAIAGAREQEPVEETPEEVDENTDETVGELPDESWKKDDIVKYLVDNEVIESEDDVKGQTKAELIENFVG